MTTSELATTGFKITVVPLSEGHLCLDIIVESHGLTYKCTYSDLAILDEDTGIYGFIEAIKEGLEANKNKNKNS